MSGPQPLFVTVAICCLLSRYLPLYILVIFISIPPISVPPIAHVQDESQQQKVKPVECVVSAGELIFVPRGWWHMAINLEPGVAITQNYVSRTNLPHVLR